MMGLNAANTFDQYNRGSFTLQVLGPVFITTSGRSNFGFMERKKAHALRCQRVPPQAPSVSPKITSPARW